MKKQIAVLMAAATAVTTVAPALANADVNTHGASLSDIVAKVKEALDTKYKGKNDDGINAASNKTLAEDYLNSRYIVLVNHAGQGFKDFASSDYKDADQKFEVEKGVYVGKGETDNNTKWFVVDDASDLAKLLESNLTAKNLKVAIIDKGADKDGNAYRTTENKYYVEGKVDDDKTEVSINDAEKELYDAVKKANDSNKNTYIKNIKVNDDVYVVSNEKVQKEVQNKLTTIDKVEVEFTGGEKITLELKGDAYDLEKPINKEGDEVDVNVDNDEDTLKTIVGFKLDENDLKDNKTSDVDIKNGDTELYTLEDVTQENISIDAIYTRESGYTKSGADFINNIVDANKVANTKDATFNLNGKNYTLTDKINFNDAKIDSVDGGFKLTFKADAKDTNDEAVKYVLKFEITGKNQKDLADILSDLKNNRTVVAGYFDRLIGENRYKTAIAVSEEQFDADEADTVVIVGGRAQVDGLSAAPLASAKNAPILLADPNTGLSKETLKEIDRVTKDLSRKVVYIVGGESSVPASVVKQIKDEFGATVVRLSGRDRIATSVSVAERIKDDGNFEKNGKVFLVGRDGAADAMSASPVAAHLVDGNKFSAMSAEDLKKVKSADRKVSPILVVDKNGLSKNMRALIKRDLEAKKAYLVGGEGSLSVQVLKDAQVEEYSIKPETVRLSGANRYETNVQVLKEFYYAKDDKNNVVPKGATATERILVGGVDMASGENDYLVDAQTAGSFAAMNNTPIVISGKELTNNQKDLFKKDEKNGILHYQKENVYQIGGVVSSDVMKFVVDKLGL